MVRRRVRPAGRSLHGLQGVPEVEGEASPGSVCGLAGGTVVRITSAPASQQRAANGPRPEAGELPAPSDHEERWSRHRRLVGRRLVAFHGDAHGAGVVAHSDRVGRNVSGSRATRTRVTTRAIPIR